MACGDGGSSSRASGNGADGHGGQVPRRGRTPRGRAGGRARPTADGANLASMLAGRGRLLEMVEDYMAITSREHELLRGIIARLEGQVATLQQQIAILSAELSLRRGGGSAAPGGDDKPH